MEDDEGLEGPIMKTKYMCVLNMIKPSDIKTFDSASMNAATGIANISLK